MSRIGRQPIVIPDKTEVKVSDGILSVKGPLGELNRKVRNDIKIEIKDKKVILTPAKKTRLAQMLWGTYASHVGNMVRGVNEPFEKKLIVEGVGYRTELIGNELILNIGFSHIIKMTIPEGLDVNVEKNTINIKGSNKEVVGQFAAEVRAVRKPEPYKGKGIRYHDEVVRRKQGKKAV